MARNSFCAYSNDFGSSLQKFSTLDFVSFNLLEIWCNICLLTYFFKICFCWFSSSIVQMSILQIFKTKILIKLSAKNVFTLIHFWLHQFLHFFSISSYFFITHIRWHNMTVFVEVHTRHSRHHNQLFRCKSALLNHFAHTLRRLDQKLKSF